PPAATLREDRRGFETAWAAPFLESRVRAAVDVSDLGSPGNQLRAGVVVGDLAFDQDRSAFVGVCLADGLDQVSRGARGQPRTAAVSCVEYVDQAGVVPVFVVLVGTVVDRRYDHVSAVVDQEDKDL